MENVVWASSAAMRGRIAMYNANALKIGIFGANCSSGRSATKVPERWSASWPDCRRLARMADAAGNEFMLPIGRWKGYGGDNQFFRNTPRTNNRGGRPPSPAQGISPVRHGPGAPLFPPNLG